MDYVGFALYTASALVVLFTIDPLVALVTCAPFVVMWIVLQRLTPMIRRFRRAYREATEEVTGLSVNPLLRYRPSKWPPRRRRWPATLHL